MSFKIGVQRSRDPLHVEALLLTEEDYNAFVNALQQQWWNYTHHTRTLGETDALYK